MYLYTILRVSGETTVLNSLVEQLNDANPIFNASVNRQKQMVLDLSKERSDWEKHCAQIIDGIALILPVISNVKGHISKVVVDISVEAPTSQKKGGISFSIYTFPANLLSLLGTNNISLEVSIS